MNKYRFARLPRLTAGMSAALLTALCAFGGDTAEYRDSGVNLLRADKIEPAYMHGKVSAFKGLLMNDMARGRYAEQMKRPIEEECFKISVDGDVGTISFSDPLAAPYVRNPGELIHLYTCVDPMPPAQGFRCTGRVRFNKGNLRLSNGLSFKPGPDWQKFDYTGRPFFILLTPAPGAAFSIADFKMTPVYPEIGGAIALPDGGKLTRLLIPENADYITRWGIAMWRGWLWKLTGVALPITEVGEVVPTSGAFAAVRDRELERGWDLQVNSEGITLKYAEEDDIVPALFDYLRLGLNCAFYASDCEKLPPLPVAELPAIDRRARPRYNAFVSSEAQHVKSGGKCGMMRYIRNDADYFHMYNSDWIHIQNILIPVELYYKDHPEYFMMNADGRREVSFRPGFTHPCFSNRAAREVMLKGIADYARAQKGGSTRLTFEPGDTEKFCLCPECVAFNGTDKTNSDLLMDFSNAAAAELKKVNPELKLLRCAYLNRCYPPKKVKPADNIDVFFCLTEHVMPCTLHIDCEKNREGMKMAEEWKRALGDDASRMGFMTYDDARPLQAVRTAEYLNRFGNGDFYMFQWHYTPRALHFVMPRWNLGEDADKLMEEFDLNYYGKAGGIMHEITMLLDEYGRDYEHREGESAKTSLFCGHRGCRTTVLTRAQLDKIYALFDKAVAAAGDDKVLRARIFEEKKYVLAEDFNRFGPATCKNDEELKAIAGRLTDFIRMARETPARFAKVSMDQDMRGFILAATGLSIPNTGKFWANEPYVDKLLADPMAELSPRQQRIPGGFYFRTQTMRGADGPLVYSYQCTPRYCTILRRSGSGKDAVTVKLTLGEAPAAATFLAIEGQDDDKPGSCDMRVTVNGHTVFSGRNPLPEGKWGRVCVTVPAGVLKAGDNIVAVANTTPDLPSRSVRFTDPEQGKNDPQWGWIALSEMYYMDPNGDFDRFLKGATFPWHFSSTPKRGATKSRISGGKLELVGGEFGAVYFGSHNTPKLAALPGSQVKISVRASGKGNLRMGLWNYLPYRMSAGNQVMELGGYSGAGTNLLPWTDSRPFRLGDKAGEFVCELTVPANGGLFIPRVYAEDGGNATVTNFRMDILPPKSE